MHKRRLLKLADLLEADARNKKGVKFDLRSWAEPAGAVMVGRFSERQKQIPVSCGTSGCAVGLACISGAFRCSGLTFAFENSLLGEGYYLAPEFNGHTNFCAVESFWDITECEAEFLFMDSSYPASKRKGAQGERYVAKRIRDFVAGKVSP